MNGHGRDDDPNGLQQAYAHTHNKLVLVENALRVLYGAQQRNPAPDDRREIDRKVLETEEERTRLNGELTGMANQATAVQPPSQAEVDQIADLSGEVERQTTGTAAARDAIDLCTRVLRASRGLPG